MSRSDGAPHPYPLDSVASCRSHADVRTSDVLPSSRHTLIQRLQKESVEAFSTFGDTVRESDDDTLFTTADGAERADRPALLISSTSWYVFRGNALPHHHQHLYAPACTDVQCNTHLRAFSRNAQHTARLHFYVKSCKYARPVCLVLVLGSKTKCWNLNLNLYLNDVLSHNQTHNEFTLNRNK